MSVFDKAPCAPSRVVVLYLSLIHIFSIGRTDKDCVLIVEDNEELLQLLTDLLSPLYRIVIAMNGKDGLQKAMEERHDLILSDVMMPEMDGIEMCSKIKTDFDLCHTPVVLLLSLIHI